ncbi:phosphate:Na+ symporter [Desulfobaculum xiamenense]|uniref:Phosphate:Na+ symporter n=1 Tax=Desulfobaculum xiamenense TaxID=995050 RepID=A0A846QHU6_9BACT|nr:Na/Pi symporter [Desulfobaculum xiamenense]NJB68416.1 phosphate:Na+ symporter [Desulfobaculum xiamenense]
MQSSSVVQLAGGLGLLLLGMKLMTDGLRLAAGGMLRRILSASTKTPLRGLVSGFGMTTAVQSSSAVTVMAIGFVNAGIMSLAHTVWVVYGSNVGSTTTAWIVAWLGFKVDIQSFALPMIAAGSALWIAGRASRRAAMGEALAGFGLFFLGIEFLQGAFGDIGGAIRLTDIAPSGIGGDIVFVALGFALTCVMQSSGATMTLVLTAVSGGMIPLDQAAAAVVGANVGTTSTAVLASIGATPAARRVAALHVAFNLITGAVAVALLPILVATLVGMRDSLGHGGSPTMVLAMFHTVFNVLGILVMWPVTGMLVRFLERRFRTPMEDESVPRYLDRNVLATPAVAVGALTRETCRVGSIARRLVHVALTCSGGACREVHSVKAVLSKLHSVVAEYATRVSKVGLSQNAAEIVPDILRVARYYSRAGEHAQDAMDVLAELEPLPAGVVSELRDAVLKRAASATLAADPSDDRYEAARLGQLAEEFETAYQDFKQALLDAGAGGELPIPDMVAHLDFMTHVHRMMDQIEKAAHMLDDVLGTVGIAPSGGVAGASA